jgi:hypothetical protein
MVRAEAQWLGAESPGATLGAEREREGLGVPWMYSRSCEGLGPSIFVCEPALCAFQLNQEVGELRVLRASLALVERAEEAGGARARQAPFALALELRSSVAVEPQETQCRRIVGGGGGGFSLPAPPPRSQCMGHCLAITKLFRPFSSFSSSKSLPTTSPCRNMHVQPSQTVTHKEKNAESSYCNGPNVPLATPPRHEESSHLQHAPSEND